MNGFNVNYKVDTEQLEKLVKAFNECGTSLKEYGEHLTLAFRNIKKEMPSNENE